MKKKSEDIITCDDFTESKRQGEIKRFNKQAEKDRRKLPQKSVKVNKRRMLEDMKMRELEEDDYY